MKIRILATLCLLSLAGCAAQPKPATQGTPAAARAPSSPQAAWQQRQASFARMSAWGMQGKVGLQLREQSGSFGIAWQQQGNDQYNMDIQNPLTGSIMAHLAGMGSGVTLQANGKTYQDASAEHLLQRQLGVSLPLAGMKYWVRGITAPGEPVGQLALDAQGRPASFQQAGWVVTYNGWQGNGWNAMPEKIQLVRAAEQAKVKVIAKTWQTRY